MEDGVQGTLTAEEFNAQFPGDVSKPVEEVAGDPAASEEPGLEPGDTSTPADLGGEAGDVAASEGAAQVMERLEIIQQSLDQANVGLQQLHADASLTFLSVVLLIGVVLGCAMSFMLSKIWRS